jgi:hypothetical protein
MTLAINKTTDIRADFFIDADFRGRYLKEDSPHPLAFFPRCSFATGWMSRRLLRSLPIINGSADDVQGSSETSDDIQLESVT